MEIRDGDTMTLEMPQHRGSVLIIQPGPETDRRIALQDVLPRADTNRNRGGLRRIAPDGGEVKRWFHGGMVAPLAMASQGPSLAEMTLQPPDAIKSAGYAQGFKQTDSR